MIHFLIFGLLLVRAKNVEMVRNFKSFPHEISKRAGNYYNEIPMMGKGYEFMTPSQIKSSQMMQFNTAKALPNFIK
jgi:hypothetical protein